MLLSLVNFTRYGGTGKFRMYSELGLTSFVWKIEHSSYLFIKHYLCNLFNHQPNLTLLFTSCSSCN